MVSIEVGFNTFGHIGASGNLDLRRIHQWIDSGESLILTTTIGVNQ
jgi:hypothetical protein